jgi:hypothetical protein
MHLNAYDQKFRKVQWAYFISIQNTLTQFLLLKLMITFISDLQTPQKKVNLLSVSCIFSDNHINEWSSK